MAGIIFTGQAQKKKLSLEESMTNPSFSMAVRQLHGFSDGAWAEVVSAGAKGDVLVKRKGEKTDTLLFAMNWKSDKKNFPKINWKDGNRLWAFLGSDMLEWSLNEKVSRPVCTLSDDAENQD